MQVTRGGKMNEFNLIGKTVGEVEVKSSESGTKYATVLLDVQKNYKKKDGDYEHDIIQVTMFKNLAEEAERISQNSLLYIKGHINANNYTKDNKIFYSSNMIADKIEYLSNLY